MDQGERWASSEAKLVRGILVRTQTLRLWWEVGLVKKSGEFIPLHPLQSHPLESPPVREQVFPLLYLTVPLDSVDASAVPDHVPEDNRLNETVDPSTTANENKSDWRSTASATAKLLLRGVRDSADAFGPLKSVAGGLCFILENCEVRPSAPTVHDTYKYPSEQRQISKR